MSKLQEVEQIEFLAQKIISENLSVRQLEELTTADNFKRKLPLQRKKNERNIEYKEVEELLKEKLGAKVKISDKKIEISFDSYYDLNRILDIIGMDGKE